eukprot:s1999_g10.t1
MKQCDNAVTQTQKSHYPLMIYRNLQESTGMNRNEQDEQESTSEQPMQLANTSDSTSDSTVTQQMSTVEGAARSRA